MEASTLAQLHDDLIRDEGVRRSGYLDSRGYMTIGVGHLIDERLGGTLPLTMIYQLLDLDIQTKLQQAQTHRWFQALDTENRRRAVLNIVFNLGSLGVCKLTNFTTLLEQKKYTEAAADLRNTLWYREVGQRGERIAQLIQDG